MRKYHFIPLLFALLYLFFPSVNNTLDSLGYAANVRDSVDLFPPHHLLSNLPAYLLTRLLHTSHTLEVICMLNAMIAAGCLAISGRIFRQLGLSVAAITYRLLLLGSCYGLLRFATDAEAYILPLFCALSATALQISYRLRYSDDAHIRRREPLMVGLLMALACLFHQIYVFWYLGLGLRYFLDLRGTMRLRSVLGYAMAGSTVLVVYLIVYFSIPVPTGSSFVHFILHDYYNYTDVGLDISATALLLTPINFVRSFVQIHGYIPRLLAVYPLLWIVPLLTVALGIWGFIRLLLSQSTYVFDANIHSPFVLSAVARRRFARLMFIIFVFQLIFAFLSSGNAEFMTMLPFLLLFWLDSHRRLHLPVLTVACWAVALCLWNVSFALLPTNLLVLQPIRPIAEFVQQHPSAHYFLREAVWTEQYYRYHLPHAPLPHIHPIGQLRHSEFFALDSLVLPSSESLGQKVAPLDSFYTDLLSQPLLSRAAMTNHPPAPPARYIVSRTHRLRTSIDTLRLDHYTLP